MKTAIYFFIFIVIMIYIIAIWNSTKEFFSLVTRFSYIIIGTISISLLTLLIFLFSKIGLNYPKKEMIGDIRKIILLIFIPINGFIVLIQTANIFTRVQNGNISKEELSKRIRTLVIIFIALILIEIFYFKHIQKGIINSYINLIK